MLRPRFAPLFVLLAVATAPAACIFDSGDYKGGGRLPDQPPDEGASEDDGATPEPQPTTTSPTSTTPEASTPPPVDAASAG